MSHGRKRILVVDDEDQMRLALRETLVRAGYDVITAFDGSNALKKLSENTFDAVITDLRMPVMDGVAFLQRALDIYPRLPIVLMTAYATVDTAVYAMKAGAFDYLMKPFSPEALEAIFERIFLYTDATVAHEEATAAETPEPRCEPKSDTVTIITCDPRTLELVQLARDVANSSANVFVSGESGTGKELFAKMVHYSGSRAHKPFVAINCAALPENLLESELFGYEKGAFTGATARKLGKFEQADGGTLLLDEVTEMPLHLQSKLLRVLQEGEVDRVGGSKAVKVDVRIVATTNRRLLETISAREFREDLYYRLNVIPIEIPPLRKRKNDIPQLVTHFVAKYNARNHKAIEGVTPEGIAALMAHDWPGNVRELENIIERAVVISREPWLTPEKLFLHGILAPNPLSEEKINVTTAVPEVAATEGVASYAPDHAGSESLTVSVGTSVQDMERRLILKTLEQCQGNRTKAADLLGITSRTLLNKIKEYRAMGIHID
nr:sigma-54 dependent transcriptional regulator [Chrysiogenes arsenatis]